VLARTPLRVRLVAVMLALVALALLLIGSTSALALRSYLIGRVDSQLAQQWVPVAREYVNMDCTEIVATRISVPTDYLTAVLSRSGRLECGAVFRSYTDEQLPSDASWPPPALGVAYTVDSSDGSRRWRMLAGRLDDGRVLVLGEDLSNVDSGIDRLVLANLLIGLAVLIGLAMAGVWLVRASLRPLVDIERTAAAIARGDLSRRVPDGDPETELGRLSRSLNTMLSQVEAAFQVRAASESSAVRSEERMRQFVADASHELRTPLTTIRGFAELYRQGAVADASDVVRRIEEEAKRMSLLVEDLLLLARLDRERPLQFAPVHLIELVNDAAEAARAVDPDRPIEVEVGARAGALVVSGDEPRLRQVIGNLVTNALTHTPPGSPIVLGLYDENTHAVIAVADQGPGLTPEQAERVFERFYRVDKARTRQAARGSTGAATANLAHSGTGLGLAIVAALVAAHHGTVEVDTRPGQGATFRVRLPLATDET